MRGAGREAKEVHLPDAPIKDRRIRDAVEVRGNSQSETRGAATPGGATRIAPVVHPAARIAGKNVLGIEIENRPAEYHRRTDGESARPATRRQRRSAVEDPCGLPEFAAIISHVELVSAVIVKGRRSGIRRSR